LGKKGGKKGTFYFSAALGNDRVRLDLEQGRSVLDIEKEWQDEVSQFIKKRSRFLLYPC